MNLEEPNASRLTTSSKWAKVSSGIPLGSALAPLLFVVFINDLPDKFKYSICKIFVDDCKIYRSGVCHCNQGIEDTSHFLLSCPSYVIQRETLMSSVNEILLQANKNNLESQLQLYLYGDPTINNSDNKNIILSTIKFIKETKRFPPPPP